MNPSNEQYVKFTRDLYNTTGGNEMSMRDRISSLTIGLAEESGEVCGVVRSHLFRDKRDIRQLLLEELGDTLFFIACLADTFGFSLDDLIIANMDKLRKRYPQHTEGFQAPPRLGDFQQFTWLVRPDEQFYDLVDSSNNLVGMVRPSLFHPSLKWEVTFFHKDGNRKWIRRECFAELIDAKESLKKRAETTWRQG